MNERLRAFVAGVVGMRIAFGIVELVHGLYQLVPSVPLAVAQRIIALTPGDATSFATGTLGKVATPVLIVVIVTSTLALAGLLAVLSLRSRIIALVGVTLLVAVALLAAFSQPFIAPIAAAITILGGLDAGTLVASLLLFSSGLLTDRAATSAETEGETSREEEPSSLLGRRREAYSGETAIGRRGFIVLAGTAAVAGAAATGVGRLLAGGGTQAADTPGSLDGGGGGSAGSTTGDTAGGATTSGGPPFPPPDRVSVDADGVPPWLTAAENFYLIDTAVSSPNINRDIWKLSVRGAVDNPFEITYDELVSMPNQEAYITMACVSNEVGGGLVSNEFWTGVPLRAVLEEAGLGRDKIDQASEQLVGRSVDGWTSGFRTDIAFDRPEALVAFGLNNSELPMKHGYPVRLVVPGLYGYVSATKWLSEIELTDWGFDAYWIKRGWSKTGPIKTQSRIDTVGGDETLSVGTVPIGGVAWAPTRGIQRVEVSTDGGESWNDVNLAAQLDVDAWRQYVYEWEAKPGEHTIKARATDGEGETQTSQEAKPIPSGATGYHTVTVTVE